MGLTPSLLFGLYVHAPRPFLHACWGVVVVWEKAHAVLCSWLVGCILSCRAGVQHVSMVACFFIILRALTRRSYTAVAVNLVCPYHAQSLLVQGLARVYVIPRVQWLPVCPLLMLLSCG
jgi:hypothetical protein